MTRQVFSPAPNRVVVPVVDCEPPPVGAGLCPPASPGALRRSRSLRPRTRRHTEHVRVADPPPAREAAVFAEMTLRRVLEVIDRRRPVTQLRPLLGTGIVDVVIALTRRSPAGPSSPAAVLRRVRLRGVDRNPEAAEVFATYSRGDRVRAVAARVEVASVRDSRRWQLVALHLG